MKYKRNSGGADPRLSEPDIYIIDSHTGQRRVMSGVEAANYAVQRQELIAEDPRSWDTESNRASITWHINHALRMGYPWDELKVRLSKAKRGERSNPRRRRNPEEARHFSSRRLSEVLTQLRYTEKDAKEAESVAIQSGNRKDFDKYNKQRIRARQWVSFLESQIKRSSPSGAWQATYEFNAVPRNASYDQRILAARKIQKAAGQMIAKVISGKRRLSE